MFRIGGLSCLRSPLPFRIWHFSLRLDHMAMCEERFPTLIRRPLAAQFMEEEVIALFSFEQAAGELPK
jgi:hypothetical protein